MDDESDNFDYYDILNVTQTASLSEIKSNYHKLLRIWHPDKNIIQPLESIESHNLQDGDVQPLESQNRNSPFSKIQKAYTVLSDPDLRKCYDKYGSEGVSLALLMRTDRSVEKNETHCIEEDIYNDRDEDGELVEVSDNFERMEKRIMSLLRKKHGRKLKEMPVHVITHFTFGGRTDIFDDMYSVYMNRSYFNLNYTSIDNSIEALVYDKYRVGCSLSSVLTRGTFGSCFGRLYLGRNVSESLECIASVDTGDFLSFKRVMLTLKKKFSDLFWGALMCGIDNTGYPNISGTLHRRFLRNHLLELSIYNGLLANYSYVKVFNKDTKVNVKLSLSPDDAGSIVRAKTYGLIDSTLAVLIRSSITEGISLEWYIRRYIDTEYLSIAKIEYRLCLKRNAVVLLLKGIINNSKVSIPLVLFKGDFNYCIFLISSLSVCTLMIPFIMEMFNRAYSYISGSLPVPDIPISLIDLMKDRPQVLRHTFYSQFAIFNLVTNKIIGYDLYNDIELKHDKYIMNCMDSIKESYNDCYLLESMIINGLKSARNESLALQNYSKSVYKKECEKNGLVILFAVYGHPEVIKYLMLLINDLNVFKSMDYGSITINKILNDCNITKLEYIYDRYSLDVTNALMMKVVDSILSISSHSKCDLVGFTNPCSNLKHVIPILYIIYTYGGNIKSITINDNEPLLLP